MRWHRPPQNAYIVVYPPNRCNQSNHVAGLTVKAQLTSQYKKVLL